MNSLFHTSKQMDLQNNVNGIDSANKTSFQNSNNVDIDTQCKNTIINKNSSKLKPSPLSISIPSRQLSSRRVTRQKNVLSINEQCMQLVSKALIKERQLRHDIETGAHSQSFNQQHIYSMQLKVQECQNIIGTATQLIRMIGDAFRETAHNIR